mmetsp:Transcript_4540/g.7411  ORF Transcript_4540/g.7411 Transcript_4540/m.7411 type:complete len:275 (+) Transcript_4540:349-1173(+)
MSGGIARWILRNAEKFPGIQKIVGEQIVKAIMRTPVPEQDLRGLPLINNPKVAHLLKSSFENKYGGMLVIIAPSGSGKSTYLRRYSNDFLKSNGHVRVLSSEVTSRAQFYEAFGGSERAGDLFDVIPGKSAIVLDQVGKLGELTGELKGLLGHLAVESRRVSAKNVILSTSDIESAKEILAINGNDKIRQAGRCTDFMWDTDLIDAFMSEEPFTSFSVSDRKRAREHAIKAASPGFLYSVADLCNDGYPDNDQLIAHRAEEYQRTWKKFQDAGF